MTPRIENEARIDVLTQSAPERVWLQVDTDGDPGDRREAIPRENWGDLTWRYESIGGQEVIYVRADLAAEVLDALKVVAAILRYEGISHAADGALERAEEAIAKAEKRHD